MGNVKEKPPLKVTLRVLAYSPRMSEETYCFQADVLVNGRLVAQASNQGKGGDTFVHQYRATDPRVSKSFNERAFDELVAFVAALPEEVSEPDAAGHVLRGKDGKPFRYKLNVAGYIDKLFDEYVRTVYIPRLEAKRYKKKCATHVIYTLHPDVAQGYEYVLKALYTGAIKYNLQVQHRTDLKEIINERFLDEAQRALIEQQFEAEKRRRAGLPAPAAHGTR